MVHEIDRIIASDKATWIIEDNGPFFFCCKERVREREREGDKEDEERDGGGGGGGRDSKF